MVLNRLGNDEAAVSEWEQCLEDDPTDMRARAYLASVLHDTVKEAPESGDGAAEE